MKVDTASFSEIQLQIKSISKLIAYLPVGCTEQHGPVLPLGTDSLIAERMAIDLCNSNRDKGHPGVVYPLISYTPSRSNQDFPGSTSVSENAFRQYISEVSHSIMRHDYSALVFVCMHGPAEPSIMEIAFSFNQAQFGSGNHIRPLILAGISSCSEVFRKHLGSLTGKHADFREFLLLYHVMGTDYFTKEKLQGLRKLGANYFASPPRKTSLLGIPMQLRSHEGIIGLPWPEDDPEYIPMADNLWNNIVDKFSTTTLGALAELESI